MGIVSLIEDIIERLLEASAKTRRAVKTAKPSDDLLRLRLQAQTQENRRACAELRRLKKILLDRRIPVAAQVLKLEDQVLELQAQLERCRFQADEKLKAERVQAEKELSGLRAQAEETRKALGAKAAETIEALHTENERLRALNERLRNHIKLRLGSTSGIGSPVN